MSVIFLMGSWNAPSELFLLRQLRMLQELDMLDCIIAARHQGDFKWEGYPVYGLSNKEYPLLHTKHPDLPYQLNKLAKLLANSNADTILCQYGTIATLFFDLLITTNKNLFIHTHGKDSHFHMHNPIYIEKLQELSKKATLICNPLTYNFLSNEDWNIPRSRLALKKTYGVEIPLLPLHRKARNVVTVLHLGRLVDFKGPDKTIRAFEIACQQGLKGRLLIAGDGPLRKKCESLIAHSPWRRRIHLLGFVSSEEAKKLYKTSDIFTQHSIKGETTGQIETFGISIIEAMAASLPVITCSIGGPKKNVVHEKTGFLIEPGDVRGQAKLFLQLAGNPELRFQIGKQAWLAARTHFSYEKERDQLRSILFQKKTIL